MGPVLSIDGLKKSFANQLVLDDFSLDVQGGEFITLLGPSGCGKTTLLRLVAGFDHPDGGTILLDGENLLTQPAEKRQVNTVFQSYALFPHLNVADNIGFGLRLKKIRGRQLRDQIVSVLRQVKMEEYARRYPHQLSGGQQQRIAMARAIVNKPKILLLDEPLSALDARLRREMQIELKRLQRQLGIAFIFVTHDQDEALSMSDRVVVMKEGRIAQLGTPRQVYEQPANLYVARFIGEINVFPGVIEKIDEKNQAIIQLFNHTVATRNNRNLQEGQKVQLLLRPEDLRLYQNGEEGVISFPGAIVERSYRGSTLDTRIALDNGLEVTACEFFDEDDPDFDYRVGERVAVSWVKGWEVVLPDESDD